MNGTSWTYAGYAQDEYRVKPRLTLQLGLRYELNMPFTEADNHLASLVPLPAIHRAAQRADGLVYPGDKGIPRARITPIPPTSRRGWAPSSILQATAGPVFAPAGDYS